MTQNDPHVRFEKMVRAAVLLLVPPDDVPPKEWRGTLTQVAEYLGIGRKTLYRWRRSPQWFEAMQEAVRQTMPTFALIALRRLAASAEREPGSAGVAAANSILDRYGLRADSNLFIKGGDDRPVRIILNLPNGERELSDGDIGGNAKSDSS